MFAGEFKDGEYWNGKGKEENNIIVLLNFFQIHQISEITLFIQAYHSMGIGKFAKKNSLLMEIALRKVKKKGFFSDSE